jgi:hypothetical protein
VASTYAERPCGEAMWAKPDGRARPDGMAQTAREAARPSRKLDYKRLGPFK